MRCKRGMQSLLTLLLQWPILRSPDTDHSADTRTSPLLLSPRGLRNQSADCQTRGRKSHRPGSGYISGCVRSHTRLRPENGAAPGETHVHSCRCAFNTANLTDKCQLGRHTDVGGKFIFKDEKPRLGRWRGREQGQRVGPLGSGARAPGSNQTPSLMAGFVHVPSSELPPRVHRTGEPHRTETWKSVPRRSRPQSGLTRPGNRG